MNAFELLQKWPSWEKASSEAIFNSPAWTMPVRWGDKPCVMRRADVKFRDVLGIDVRFDDEENTIWLGNREAFPDLHVLWDVKSNLPDALKLALVEKECGPLFQILENAVRRQLNVVGVAPVGEERASSTGFEIVAQDGKIMASFNFKVNTDIIRSFGMLKFIDLNHESILSMKRIARANYASFHLTEEELAGLAPGDFLLLPEIGKVPPKWQTELPKDDGIHICAPDTQELTFAQYAGDQLPDIPTPDALALFHKGVVIANGRLTTLAGTPACAIEEVL